MRIPWDGAPESLQFNRAEGFGASSLAVEVAGFYRAIAAVTRIETAWFPG